MTNPNNLALQLTRLIGREREIEEIDRLLSSTRLLTLTGAGGCGKTRLAQHVALKSVDAFVDGVWFIELAPLSDAVLVPEVIASVFGLPQISDIPIDRLLEEFCRAKKLLLFLDNCEHLIQACAELAGALLRKCPDVIILATSREALNIAGETAYRVPSLEFPDPHHLPPIESLSRYDAVRLFIDRAVSVRSAFVITSHNAPAVAQICQRLGGIPLAIELAAANIKFFAAEEIAARLSDRFKLLTGGSRIALLRQQTLRATIDWSYATLSGQEQIILNRLAVFAGGWTLKAVEAICSGDGIEPSQVMNLIERLIDKSLVIAQEQRGSMRYDFLETIREYARDKLSNSGEADVFHRRHLEWFTQFAKEADSKLRSAEMRAGLDQLDDDLENCRGALGWAFENEASADGAELNAALAMYFFQRNYYREANYWSEKAVRLTRAEPAAPRAEALFALASALANIGEYSQAETTMELALTLYRSLDNQPRLGRVLTMLGVIGYRLGRSDQAEQYWQEALELRRANGDKWGITQTLQNFHSLALRDGDYARALAVTEEGLKLSEELGDERMIARWWADLGLIAYAQGDFKQAAAMLKKAVSAAWRRKEKFSLFQALEPLAEVIAAQGRPRRAAQILGAIDFGHAELGWKLSEKQRANLSQVISSIQAQLGEAEFTLAFNEGRAMTLEQAVEYALEPASDDLPPKPSGFLAGLTEREVEVLRWLALGFSNQEIAAKLVLSKRTVHAHLRSIYNKLDVTTRTAAVRAASEYKEI